MIMRSLAISLVMVFAVAMAVPVFAAPFLVCDDADITNVDSYVVEIDGVEHTAPYPLKFDLDGITDGQHVVRAKAVNDLWGVSDWSDPFEFASGAALTPTGFGLTAQ
jgi:hypothetical protein